jgi:hypothetical protein
LKIFFSIFFLLAVVLAIYPFIDSSENNETVTGLPWQVEVFPDGSTQVFGLKVGSSRLSDALEILGNDMELAIIAATDEVGNLEMYYGHYRAGLLSGKLVLQTDISEEKIKQWRDNAVTFEYMASGLAKKYFVSPDDLLQVLAERIIGITFIPAVNLDEEVILARFGEPSQKIELPGVTHYLYPGRGLDIALHEKAKEVMQYVSPTEFQQLVQPLMQPTE